MRTVIATLALAAAALAGGCADPIRAPLQVHWTFAGQTCKAAGVDVIQVDIPHELLTPNQFDCIGSDGQMRIGADLGNFLLGNYSITVSGLTSQGSILYQTTQAFTVQDTDNVVTVDAARAAAGSVTLLWSFSGLSCAQAGITSVQISLDGAVVVDAANNPNIACSAGGTEGTQISPIAPGTHTFDLVALHNGQPLYALANLQVAVVSGQDTSLHVDLPASSPTFATAELSWDALISTGGFAPGALGALTCSEAQVDRVQIFIDPLPDGTGGTPTGSVNCTTNGISGAEVSPITAGTHSFSITGIRNTAGGPLVVYQTTRPPSALFELGLFTNVDVAADALGTATGAATLQWDFSSGAINCATALPIGITYQLTTPSGTALAPQASSCGNGVTGVSLSNLDSGLWNLDATSTNGFSVHILFGVPNQAVAAWQIPFTK
jgi:hypothetical protein